MTPEQKQIWVRALRSGEYKQGKNKLKTTSNGNTYFCCLGVAKDLFDLKTSSQKGNYGEPQTLESSFLFPKEQQPLMEMNDGGKPFSDIADYIEKNY